MTRHEYTLVDVFTDRKFGGNQLAVFTDGRGIRDETMQSVAKELNLPETTFVVPAADQNPRLRWWRRQDWLCGWRHLHC